MSQEGRTQESHKAIGILQRSWSGVSWTGAQHLISQHLISLPQLLSFCSQPALPQSTISTAVLCALQLTTRSSSSFSVTRRTANREAALLMHTAAQDSIWTLKKKKLQTTPGIPGKGEQRERKAGSAQADLWGS